MTAKKRWCRLADQIKLFDLAKNIALIAAAWPVKQLSSACSGVADLVDSIFLDLFLGLQSENCYRPSWFESVFDVSLNVGVKAWKNLT